MKNIKAFLLVTGMFLTATCLGHGAHGGSYHDEETEQSYPSENFLGEDLWQGDSSKKETGAYLDGEYVEKCVNARTCDEYGNCHWLCR